MRYRFLQDSHRIYDFVGRDPSRSPHGRVFFLNPHSNEQSHYFPSPDLLRDHFRQCILRHAKGAGESNDSERRFDLDVDLRAGGGFNLVRDNWWSSSEGKKQLEAELVGRLWGFATTGNQADH